MIFNLPRIESNSQKLISKESFPWRSLGFGRVFDATVVGEFVGSTAVEIAPDMDLECQRICEQNPRGAYNYKIGPIDGNTTHVHCVQFHAKLTGTELINVSYRENPNFRWTAFYRVMYRGILE